MFICLNRNLSIGLVCLVDFRLSAKVISISGMVIGSMKRKERYHSTFMGGHFSRAAQFVVFVYQHFEIALFLEN